MGSGWNFLLSGRRGSNPRPQPWQGCALPTELLPHNCPESTFEIRSTTSPSFIIHFSLLLNGVKNFIGSANVGKSMIPEK